MQKLINVLAIASALVSLTVVGTAGYVYVRKDAIIESVKEKVMSSVVPDMPSLPNAGSGTAVPPMGGGFGIPNF